MKLFMGPGGWSPPCHPPPFPDPICTSLETMALRCTTHSGQFVEKMLKFLKVLYVSILIFNKLFLALFLNDFHSLI
jgi:hypothetical protein